MLTVVRHGSHVLHSVHVVDGDASGNVWPACGLGVDYNDILQPWHIAQYGLEMDVGVMREEVRGKSNYAKRTQLLIKL